MKTYLLFIHDRRYAVPTLDSVSAPGDEQAVVAARRRLSGSGHYYGAEVWEEDRLVGRLGEPLRKEAVAQGSARPR